MAVGAGGVQQREPCQAPSCPALPALPARPSTSVPSRHLCHGQGWSCAVPDQPCWEQPWPLPSLFRQHPPRSPTPGWDVMVQPGVWRLLGRINTVGCHQGLGGDSQATHFGTSYLSKPLLHLWCQLESFEGQCRHRRGPGAAAGCGAPAPVLPEGLRDAPGCRHLAGQRHAGGGWQRSGLPRAAEDSPVSPAPSPFLPVSCPHDALPRGPCPAGAGCPWTTPCPSAALPCVCPPLTLKLS